MVRPGRVVIDDQRGIAKPSRASGTATAEPSPSGQRKALVPQYEEAPITAPPAALSLDPFYTKYTDAGGIPIVSSDAVPDAALLAARSIVSYMVSARPDVRAVMVERGQRVGVMAQSEMQTDLPEYRDWKKPAFDDPRLTPGERERYYQPGGIASMSDREYWNRHARGMGGRYTTAAEENILGYPGTRYYGEHILVHEFSHAVMGALRGADPSLYQEIQDAYAAAKAKGLFKGHRLAEEAPEFELSGLAVHADGRIESTLEERVHAAGAGAPPVYVRAWGLPSGTYDLHLVMRDPLSGELRATMVDTAVPHATREWATSDLMLMVPDEEGRPIPALEDVLTEDQTVAAYVEVIFGEDPMMSGALFNAEGTEQVAPLPPVALQRAGDRILGLLSLLFIGPSVAQQRPTFEAMVARVRIDVIVTDDNGRFVEGLGADDFVVFEDGEPQDVLSVELVGGSTGARTRVLATPSAAVGAVTPAAGESPALVADGEGRALVFLVDLPGMDWRNKTRFASAWEKLLADSDDLGVRRAVYMIDQVGRLRELAPRTFDAEGLREAAATVSAEPLVRKSAQDQLVYTDNRS